LLPHVCDLRAFPYFARCLGPGAVMLIAMVGSPDSVAVTVANGHSYDTLVI